jgi:integrase
LALGVRPDESLAAARERRDAARTQVAEGLDPLAEKKPKKIRAQIDSSITFKSIAEKWLIKCEREGRAEITLEKVRWLLDMAYPVIGARRIAQIDVQEVLVAPRKLEATGRYESARRMRSVVSRVFRYGIATARCQRDVAADLRGAIVVPKTKYFAAITTPKEAGELLRAIEEYSGQAITKFALRMTPHVFVRPGELRRAEWSEFDFDRSVWSIPAEKMKMRWPHKVPLSLQVLAILEEAARSPGTARACSLPSTPGSARCRRIPSPLRCGAWLRQGPDDRARLRGDGGNAAQRDGNLEPRCDRASARPYGKQWRASRLCPRALLGRARGDDAALVRLSRCAS